MKVDPSRPTPTPPPPTPQPEPAGPTPGEWTQDRDGAVVLGGQRCITPECAAPDGASAAEQQANLRLFAAAKDALEALKHVEYLLEREFPGADQTSARVVLRAAIAKAEGVEVRDMAEQPIAVHIFPDPLAWLKENLEDVASSIDSASAVVAVRFRRVGPLAVTVLDKEEGSKKRLEADDLVRGLRLLVEYVQNGAIDRALGTDEHKGRRFYGSGWKSPLDMMDAGNWDVESADALFQCAWYGEVRYG